MERLKQNKELDYETRNSVVKEELNTVWNKKYAYVIFSIGFIVKSCSVSFLYTSPRLMQIEVLILLPYLNKLTTLVWH